MTTNNTPGPTEQYIETLSKLLAACASAARQHRWPQLYEAIRTGHFALILSECGYAAHSREDDAQFFEDIRTDLATLHEEATSYGLDMDAMLQHRDARPTLLPW